MNKIRLLILISILAVTCCGAGKLETPLPDALEQASALKGVRWLMGRDMPPGFELLPFRKIYRVIPDQDLADDLAEMIEKRERQARRVDTSIYIHGGKYLNWYNLRPVVAELLRRKCAGERYERDAEEVNKLLEMNWSRLFPERMILSQKLVAGYLLKELEVGRRDFYETTIARIRMGADILDKPSGYEYLFYLYALTHVVFTQSGYYDEYLDPSRFAFEISCFDKILKGFASSEVLHEREMDIVSEILICLKLLRQPSRPVTEMMRRKLMTFQNHDGSWGQGKETTSRRVHLTFVAAMALLDFAPVFRGGEIHCDMKDYR